jgi:hypothetical protein
MQNDYRSTNTIDHAMVCSSIRAMFANPDLRFTLSRLSRLVCGAKQVSWKTLQPNPNKLNPITNQSQPQHQIKTMDSYPSQFPGSLSHPPPVSGLCQIEEGPWWRMFVDREVRWVSKPHTQPAGSRLRSQDPRACWLRDFTPDDDGLIRHGKDAPPPAGAHRRQYLRAVNARAEDSSCAHG